MKSLGDELAGAGAPPAQKPQGKRVSPLGPDETAPPTETTEEPKMPRKKRKASTPSLHQLRDQVVAAEEAPKKKRKYTRRAKPAPAKSAAKRATGRKSQARFGVFSDGSVHVDAASCKGVLEPEEAAELVAFMERLKGGK